MTTKLDRIGKDIQKIKSKIAESQKQFRELEIQKTRQENLQIIRPVCGMNMEPGEFAAFLCNGAVQAAPATTSYYEQKDNAREE